MAQIIKDTKGAIGYVDLSDAKASGLKYANVKNQAGKFIEPTAESASAAGDGIDVPDNLVFSALNSTAPEAYPITYQSWVIVYEKQPDAAKAALLKAYLVIPAAGRPGHARRPGLRPAAGVDPGEGRRPAGQDHLLIA